MTIDQGIVLFTIFAAILLFLLRSAVSRMWWRIRIAVSGCHRCAASEYGLPRGFGSDATLLILGLLMLTAGLNRTGVIDNLGSR